MIPLYIGGEFPHLKRKIHQANAAGTRFSARERCMDKER